MRTCLYIGDYGVEGGATKSLVNVVVSMKKYCNIYPIVCSSGDRSINKTLNDNGIENVITDHGSFMVNSPIHLDRKILKYLFRLYHYWLNYYPSIKKAEDNIDFSKVSLIHTNLNRNDLGIELSKRHHIPNIMHLREFGKEDFNCWTYRRNLIDYLNTNVDGFIAISNAVKQCWINKGLISNKIHVIYNGVDNQSIRQKTSSFADDGIFKMVIVGGIIPNKGQEQAVHAVAELVKKGIKNIHLDIIGWGDTRHINQLMSFVSAENLSDYITFTGNMPSVNDKLADYDIGLMCSKSEGFGRTTAEYMHAGLAIIASDGGASPELVSDQTDGLIYRWGDIESLTQCIQKYINDTTLMSKVAQNAKEKALREYTIENNVKKISAFYEEIISNYHSNR